MKGILTNVIFSGVGLSFIRRVFCRLIRKDALKKSGIKAGRILSKTGRSRLGKKFWEGLENFIENSLGVVFSGLKEGWNEDDDR